ALMEGNREKTLAAPVTAILGNDGEFYEHLPRLFPHADARSWFAGPENAQVAAITALRNGTLQGAYFMLAARALGLDCGPMSGFDNAAVDREFFPGGRVKSNFLCNLGYGDPAKLFPRSPRFEFDEVCSIV
ncbi:MAG TPA: malonic semialdehyde reductase, partial [Rhodocyclaceae bacterium]|nr:malonic semialdehyde reductase [Rhodocyclaceae bacterium]